MESQIPEITGADCYIVGGTMRHIISLLDDTEMLESEWGSERVRQRNARFLVLHSPCKSDFFFLQKKSLLRFSFLISQ